MKIPYLLMLSFFAWSFLCSNSAANASAAYLTPVHLRCEYRKKPLGVDSQHPRLSWVLRPSSPPLRDMSQKAYHILVASSPSLLAKDQGDLWNSGNVSSDSMNQIAYLGKPLRSDQPYWWKVRVTDQSDRPSPWSGPATWTMGVLHPADWHNAKWIASPNALQPINHNTALPEYETLLLRHDFIIKPGLKRALVNVCGLGQYVMSLNGKPVTSDVLTPGWTLYNKTCLYDTYNITPLLHAGKNAAAFFLGNGMYNIHGGRYTKITDDFGPVQAIALIHLEYANGNIQNVVTNASWHVASGPITFSSIYGGEDYDARLVQPGWDMPDFSAAHWAKPAVTQGPGGTLRGLSCAGPPIKIYKVLKPVSHQVISPTVTVYNLRQNASLMLHLVVHGPAGSFVRVTPSELVHKNGTINDIMCNGQSYWTYTLNGKGNEVYNSYFYYRGGQYLQVERFPAPGSALLPHVIAIQGDVIRADAPVVGHFSCSSELYDKVYSMIRWAQKNNMVSIMTDCPTREKLGWLEEDHLNGPSLRYNFDLSSLMTKMTNDMHDSQRKNGLVPSTAPDYPHWASNNPFADPPEWGSACIAVPWQQYEFDGDLHLLHNCYGTMQKYVDYLSSRANDNIINFGLGDWYDNQQEGPSTLTPVALTATAFYYFDTHTLAHVAALLGRKADAAKYRQQAKAILTSFNVKFYHRATHTYATGSQSSEAFPLAMNMVPAEDRSAVLANLEENLTEKGSTAGEVGLRFLLVSLAKGGDSNLIYHTYHTQKSGYGLQVKEGKTCLTEGWDGTNSQDHFMFGQINEWFYRFVAGIQGDPSGPGFKKIIIHPAIVHGLDQAGASYDSIEGMIVSHWKRHGTSLSMDVEIPANTTATIFVPSQNQPSVTEDKETMSRMRGVHFVKMQDGCAVYHVGSGTYHFNSRV